MVAFGGRFAGVAAVALVVGVAAPAAAVTYTNALTAGFAGFDRNLFPVHGLYAATPTTGGAVLTKAAGSGDGGVELLSRFTFTGPFRITVDVAGLNFGLGPSAEAGLGVKAPGCCSNGAFADIFGFGSGTRANNHIGLTELSRTGFAGGDQLALAGDTGGGRYRLNLFLDQEFGGVDANRVTFTNLRLTAGAIQPGIPEPAAWSLMIAGFGLVGAALRRRESSLSITGDV